MDKTNIEWTPLVPALVAEVKRLRRECAIPDPLRQIGVALAEKTTKGIWEVPNEK